MLKKRTSRPMRLPNGFGSVVKLSGKRRNPYMARPPVTAYRDNGSPITPKAIGYYPDWPSAYEALLEYRRNPYDVDTRRITFAEVYKRMIAEKKSLPEPPSKSTFQAYQAAFKNCAVLHPMPFADIRLNHLQGVVNDCPLKYSSLVFIVNLYHQLYKYALKFDICEKDYSAFVSILKKDDNEKGVPFNEEELSILWNHWEDPTVSTMLIMIYTGFRISAAEKLHLDREKWYFRGGVKTSAGKDRIVPIHPGIQNLVESVYSPDTGILACRAQEYRKRMYKCLESLNIKRHTPHDCRHTFSWLCDKYEVDTFAKKLLMGHCLGKDVTDKVYGHRMIDELRIEIEKIQVPEIKSCH